MIHTGAVCPPCAQKGAYVYERLRVLKHFVSPEVHIHRDCIELPSCFLCSVTACEPLGWGVCVCAVCVGPVHAFRFWRSTSVSLATTATTVNSVMISYEYDEVSLTPACFQSA